MQIHSTLAVLAGYIAFTTAAPVASPQEATMELDPSVQHFNAFDGTNCGGAPSVVANTFAMNETSWCFSFDSSYYGFVPNEPRCVYERFIVADCAGTKPLVLASPDCTNTVRGPWSMRQTCDSDAEAVW